MNRADLRLVRSIRYLEEQIALAERANGRQLLRGRPVEISVETGTLRTIIAAAKKNDEQRRGVRR